MKGAREGRDNDGWMEGRKRSMGTDGESAQRGLCCRLPGKRREMEDGGKEDRLVGERKEREREKRHAGWQSDGALVTTDWNRSCDSSCFCWLFYVCANTRRERGQRCFRCAGARTCCYSKVSERVCTSARTAEISAGSCCWACVGSEWASWTWYACHLCLCCMQTAAARCINVKYL